MKRKLWLLGIPLLCAAAGLAAAWYAPAAYLGDIPIGARELQVYLDENRAQTAAYFSSNYQLDLNGKDAWSQDCGGITPREYLLQAALDDLAHEKALLLEGREAGREGPLTGEEIERARREENRLREGKIARGEVVYGPQEYGSMEYRSYLCSEAETAVKEAVLRQSPPSEQILRELYAQMTPELLERGYEAQVDYYYLSQDLPLSNIQRQELLSFVAQGAGQSTPEQLLEDCKARYGVEPVYQLLLVGPDARKGEDLLQMELYQEIKEVEAETVRQVLRDGRLAAVLYVRGKESYGTIPFEEAEDLAREQWTAQALESRVKQRAELLKVREGIFMLWKIHY